MSARREQKNKDDGFTLIELMVSMLILAAAVIGILGLLPTGYSQITVAGRMATLDHVAQQKLDYLRALPITASYLTDGAHPTTVEFPLGTDAKYTVKWTVSSIPGLSNAKRIALEAAYDYYNPDGTDKADDEGLDQRKVFYYTVITQ